MAGQAKHFRAHAPASVPYAIDRYTRETSRLYGVLNKRLEHREFIVAGGSPRAVGDAAESRTAPYLRRHFSWWSESTGLPRT